MARPGARTILVARFFYFFMDIGLAKSFGVFIPALEEQFGTSNATIGLVTSIALAMMYLACPFAKIVLQRCVHTRLLTACCGLTAGVALIGTAFTRSVLGLSMLFLVMGLSCSVVNLQAIILLHDYYQDDFPFASCASVMGIPVGAAILPPLTEKILEAYGLSGTLLVVGAMVLNMFPIGLLMKRSTTRRETAKRRPIEGMQTQTPTGDLEHGEVYSAVTAAHSPNHVHTLDAERILLNDGRTLDDVTEGSTSRIASGTINVENMPGQSYVDTNSSRCSVILTEPHEETLEMSLFLPREKSLNDPCRRSDSGRTASVQSSSFNQTDKEVSTSKSNRRIHRCLVAMQMDVLVKEPLFTLVYLPKLILLMVTTGGWALFIVLYAVEHGIDIARGAYLATSGAVGGVISSVLMSVVLWYRPRWSLGLYLVSLGLAASALFSQTLLSSYPYLLVMSFLIGCGLFAANVLVETVMMRTVDEESFPDASAFFNCCIGVGFIISGYTAGFVYDRTGDVKSIYYFLGTVMTVAFSLQAILMICLARNDRKKLKASV